MSNSVGVKFNNLHKNVIAMRLWKTLGGDFLPFEIIEEINKLVVLYYLWDYFTSAIIFHEEALVFNRMEYDFINKYSFCDDYKDCHTEMELMFNGRDNSLKHFDRLKSECLAGKYGTRGITFWGYSTYGAFATHRMKVVRPKFLNPSLMMLELLKMRLKVLQRGINKLQSL